MMLDSMMVGVVRCRYVPAYLYVLVRTQSTYVDAHFASEISLRSRRFVGKFLQVLVDLSSVPFGTAPYAQTRCRGAPHVS